MIKASIVVTTYNHERYVAQCFESIIMQKTHLPVEIIWYDDASTDKTIQIGEEVLKKTNWQVTRIHHVNNRRSRGVATVLEKIEKCSGDFVFLAEGDDFWLTEDKLDRQIDRLILYPDVNICFTPACVVSDVDSSSVNLLAYHSRVEKIFSADEVIVGDGGFMPTISLCLRRNVFDSAPDWLYSMLPVGDYPLQVIASLPNGALYLPDVTCAYRQTSEGSWTSRVYNNAKNRVKFEAEFIDMLMTMHETFPEHRMAFEKITYRHFFDLFKFSMQQGNFLSLQKAATSLLRFEK